MNVNVKVNGGSKAKSEKGWQVASGGLRVTSHPEPETAQHFLQPDSRVKNYGELVTTRRRKARVLLLAS